MIKRFVITLFIILTINFFLPRAIQADPFLFMSDDESGLSLEYSEEQIQKYKAYYGLDKPLMVQYLYYLKNTMSGNFGYSITYNEPVGRLIGRRIFWTMGIVVASLVFSVILGALLGCISAWFRDTAFDHIFYGFNVGFSQIPNFIIASVILLVFSTALRGMLPTSGGMTPFLALKFDKKVILDIVKHSILPVCTLSLLKLPDYYMITRGAMLHEIQKEYVITAKAKGLKRFLILFKHCLINAINPLITRVFMSLGHLFGGAIIIENVFQYPGVGTLMREAVFFQDYTLIQAIFFIIAILVMVFSQLTEITYNRH